MGSSCSTDSLDDITPPYVTPTSSSSNPSWPDVHNMADDQPQVKQQSGRRGSGGSVAPAEVSDLLVTSLLAQAGSPVPSLLEPDVRVTMLHGMHSFECSITSASCAATISGTQVSVNFGALSASMSPVGGRSHRSTSTNLPTCDPLLPDEDEDDVWFVDESNFRSLATADEIDQDTLLGSPETNGDLVARLQTAMRSMNPLVSPISGGSPTFPLEGMDYEDLLRWTNGFDEVHSVTRCRSGTSMRYPRRSDGTLLIDALPAAIALRTSAISLGSQLLRVCSTKSRSLCQVVVMSPDEEEELAALASSSNNSLLLVPSFELVRSCRSWSASTFRTHASQRARHQRHTSV